VYSAVLQPVAGEGIGNGCGVAGRGRGAVSGALPAAWVIRRRFYLASAQSGGIEDNRAFHAHLQSLGIPHIYHEFPGAHTWDYWDEHIQQVLPFVMEAMGE
jgi:S-formylglutathione hydrolase FrmB